MRSHLAPLLLGISACATPAAPRSGGVSSSPPDAVGVADLALLERATKIREATLQTSMALETVRALIDEASPRLSGSAGFTAAVAWAERAMTAAGLAGVHIEKVMVPHWERGDERGEIVAPYAHRMAIAALGGSVGTEPAGLEAEVVEAESLDALARLAPGAVRGKIVFFRTVMQRTKDGAGYGKAVVVRLAGAIEAAKLGAVGVIIRSMGTDESRTPHTGAMRYETQVPAIPAAALSIPDADMLHRILARGGGTVRFKMSLGARTLPDSEGFNVVGDVPGNGAPQEIVLLGAHLDSWDLGQGALDDGAGCAIVLEAARQIARAEKPPRRTVRVVFFANEENGLAGAKAYAMAHESELDKHVLALESDFGTGRAYETRFLGGAQQRAQFLRVAASVRPLGIEVSDGKAEGGADLTPLQALGVPLMDLRQDGSLYFDFHHSANDTVEHLDKGNLAQVAAAYAAAAYAAAETPGDFGRVPIGMREHHR